MSRKRTVDPTGDTVGEMVSVRLRGEVLDLLDALRRERERSDVIREAIWEWIRGQMR